MTAAPRRPATCDLDPACSATAVREPLALTGNPWKKPAAMPPLHQHRYSLPPYRLAPARPAGRRTPRPSTWASARATTAMASAPTTSVGMSDHITNGTVNGGKICRNVNGSTPRFSSGRGS